VHHRIAGMKLRDLEYLTAAAAEGNFSRAARRLGISTSTIGRRIGRLEDELGLALFERSSKGIRLTAGGQAVLRCARRALAELDAVKLAGKQNGTGAVGEVRLGVRVPPLGERLRGLLAAWRQSCSDVLLTVAEMNERDLAIALAERRLDAALAPARMVPHRAAAIPVCRERLLAAVPSGHRLARRTALGWPELSRQTILVQGWDECQAERDLLSPMLGAGAAFHSHAASRQSLLALVAAGFGIAVVTESQAETAVPGVAVRPIDEPDAVLQLELAWMPEAEEPAVGRFIAFIRDEARSRRLLLL
jgi:DNA-binding transcriptional LysR family regulator